MKDYFGNKPVMQLLILGPPSYVYTVKFNLLIRLVGTEGGDLIPELQEIGALRKHLPYGRYLTTMEELEETYAPADDANRRKIWLAFEEVTSIVRQAYGRLAAVWLGGSFITSERWPHDIDVVYLVDEDSYRDGIKGPRGRFITQVLLRKNPVTTRLNQFVDAYLFPVPPTAIDNNYNYSAARGYWDQFWSKARYEEGNSRWLYPAAGYLEVMIDGYDS